MKKFIIGFILGALLFSIIPVSAIVQQYVLNLSNCKLLIDEEEFDTGELPILNYKGYNYIPVAVFRKICEKLGIGFEFDNVTKKIKIDTQKGGNDVSNAVIIDSETGIEYIIYDEKKYMEYAKLAKYIAQTYNCSLLRSSNDSLILLLRQPQNKNERVLNVPYLKINEKTYIEKDFYDNIAVPILQGNADDNIKKSLEPFIYIIHDGKIYYEYGNMAGNFHDLYPGYLLSYDYKKKSIFLIKPGNIRIEGLEHVVIDGNIYIEKEYYLNTILSLVEEGAN